MSGSTIGGLTMDGSQSAVVMKGHCRVDTRRMSDKYAKTTVEAAVCSHMKIIFSILDG